MDLKLWVAMAPTKDAQKLRRAAERKGKAEDQYQLALLYSSGREGLKQDLVAAAAWSRKAAAQQHASAQYNIGRCYAKDEGVEQNDALAATWLIKAVDQGDVRAQGYLCGCYHVGQGVEQDDALAVSWWEKAAVRDHVACQLNLCLGYMPGMFSLTSNEHCTKIYMMAAAAQGNARAIEALEVLWACAACGALDATRACQGCMSVTGLSTVRYCNPKCQTAHWKPHKADCGGRQACACHRCKSDRGETGA